MIESAEPRGEAEDLELLAVDFEGRRIEPPARPQLDDFSWVAELRAERIAAQAPQITGLVHTRNEERNLADALRSLGWVDKLVVVDMESDDETLAIAAEFNATILRVPLTSYVEPARAAAVAATDTEWVLIVDADERVQQGLALELDRISREDAADVVDIFCRTWIAGRFLGASGWQHDWHPRFFRKGFLEFSPRIHSVPAAKGRRGRVEDTQDASLIHFNYEDLAHFVAKLNRYTDAEAEALIGEAPLTWPALAQLLRGEFAGRWTPQVDGSLSAALAFSMLFYRLISQAKHWQFLGYPPIGLPDDWQSALADLANEGRLIHQAGLAAAADGRRAEAADMLARAAKTSVDVELLNDLAVLRFEQGQRDDAIALLRACLVINPEHAAARQNLASLEG